MTETNEKFFSFIISGIFILVLVGVLIAVTIAKSPNTLYDKVLYSINSYIFSSDITKDIKQNNTEYSANFIITEDKENYKYEIIIKRTKVDE